MNCFNHPERPATATCINCGKGLCVECSKLYTMPICNECNLARSKNESNDIIKQYIPSAIGLIIGIFIGIDQFHHPFAAVLFGYVFAGIPWGWKVISFIQPKMFLFLSLFGWVIYFMIKFFLAYFVGIVAMPIGIIRLIIKQKQASDKKNNIQNNLKQ